METARIHQGKLIYRQSHLDGICTTLAYMVVVHTTPSSWVFQGTNIDFTEEELENGAASAR